jgi:hypothetical protein
MLTAQLYPQMKDGPSLLVSGELFADGTWHVSVWLHQRQSGHWRMGRETDSETYVLNHVMASKPARCGAHRVASKTERRELLRQVYEFVDEQFRTGRGVGGHEPSLPPATNIPKETKTMEPMNAARCAIYTKYGKGPQCPKLAAIGSDICSTHKYLETKLGNLPRQPVTTAPVVEVVPVVAPVPVVVEQELMAARSTPDAMADSFAAATEPVAPAVEPAPTVVEEAPKKIRKARKDKGTRHATKR